ncbi:unnamed protein product [Closterium sp. NIES-53]
MYITLYFLVTRLPDYLRAVRDHFLALDPTDLTVDLLEQHLLAAKTSVVAVGAARGTLRTPFFEGCSPSPLAPSYAYAAAADVSRAEDVRATSASAKRCSSKGKGGRGGGGGSGGGGGGSSGDGGGSGGGGRGGSGGGSGGIGSSGGGSGGSGGSGSGGSGGGWTGARRGGSGGGHRQQQQRRSETLSPQQLREWFAQRGASGVSVSCPYVIRMGDRAGQTCGKLYTQHRCFSRLDDAWHAEFGDEAELLRSGVAIFDLDYDAILAAIYALSVSAEGDCYLCMPPDPGIEAVALGASEFVLPGTALAEALHTFTLDSVLAHSSTMLPCHAVPSGSLSGLHFPSFSTNLTLLWHHRLGHPSLPRLRGMHSHLLVSGLHRSLPPLPPSPAPPCLPCVEGQQRAAPHSSSFPPTTATLQTLHTDVWGPAHVSGLGRERYLLLVVDDYTQYTMVFPLRSKGEVVDVLIPWIRAVHLQLCERFSTNLPVLRLHSNRAGEFSSDLLRDFCHGEGILQTFTLPDSPLKNWIAERRIGLVMEVARTFMINAAAPIFYGRLRSGTLRIISTSGPMSPCRRPRLHYIGPGKLAMRRCSGSGVLVPLFTIRLRTSSPPGWKFYHPTSRRVLPSQDVMFDESVPFYRHFPYRSAPPSPPPLFLAPGPPPVDPLPPQGPSPSGVSQVDPFPGSVPVEVAVGSGAAPCTSSGGAASRGAEPGGAESEGVGSGGVVPEGAEPGGAEPEGVEPGGAEPEGVEPGGAESESAESGGAECEGAESEGAEPRGTTSSGGPVGASPRLSPRPEPLSLQQLREWFSQCTRLQRGAAGAGVSAAGDTGAGGAGVTAGAGGTGGAAAAGPRGARTGGTGAAGTGGVWGAGSGDPTEPVAVGAGAGVTSAGGAGARGAGVVDRGARGARGTVRPRPYFVPLLQQVLGVPSSTSLIPPPLCPPPDQSQLPLQPASSLPAPSPYTEKSGVLTECNEPASRLAFPVRTSHRVPRLRPPPVPGTHAMALRPSSVPLRVPLLPPPESSLDRARDARPSVSRLLASIVTGPSFESIAASALVAELVEFSAALVAESESASPPSCRGCCTSFGFQKLAPEGDPDAPEIPTPHSYTEAITSPYSSQWQAAMDAEMALWKSTGTYVDAVPPSRANIVDGMWILRVKRPSGSPPAFKARYVARGFSQRQGVDYFQTFSPTPKMTTLRVLLHVAAQRDYELHSLDFTTAFLQGSLHEAIWLRRPPGFTGTSGGQSTVLQRFCFQFSSPQPTPLSTGHLLSAPPSVESVEPSGPYPELVGCLMYLMTCTRPDLAYPLSLLAHYVAPGRYRKVHWDVAKRVVHYLCSTSGMGLVLGGRGLVVLIGHAGASWVDDSATQRSSQGYTLSLGSRSVSWPSTCSSSVLGSIF